MDQMLIGSLADHRMSITQALAEASSKNCVDRGDAIVASFGEAAQLLFLWLKYLEESEATGVADCLIHGVRAAANESAACLCLGLVRPALTSMRLELDLLLGWIYFKDHPKEWERVSETGDGYKLKTETIRYLSEHYPRFKDRFGILGSCAVRSTPEPYRLLSAHIHGQSEYVLPLVTQPSDIVGSAKQQDEAIAIQAECAEYLSDVLWSLYAERWASLDATVLKSLVGRFKTAEQKEKFFA